MKKTFLQILAAIGLTIGLMISAPAQTAQQYRAHIPFDFKVGGAEFKAGDYLIGVVNPQVSRPALVIREATGRSSQILMILPKEMNERRQTAQLIFNRYEDQYYLAQMKTPTLNTDFVTSKPEKSLARNQKSTRQTIGLLK